jgi:pimeloyl-ACP methyl ester carboxylesterase
MQRCRSSTEAYLTFVKSMISCKRITAIGLLAALAAAGSTWIAYQYHRDIVRARARAATGSRVISTPCGPIEYAEVGSGPVILAIHGAGGGFDQGLTLAGPLAANGHRVIAMSRFGYLRTPAPSQPSIALQADAHACLLDALGVKSAAVIGVSAGAASALEFALRHPARCTALVLQVPGWYPPDRRSFRRLGPLEALVFDQFLRSDFLFWVLTRFMPSTSDSTVLGTPPAVVAAGSPSERARVATILRDILPVSHRQVGLSLERQLTVADLSKPLESIAVPTLAISAEDDLYGTYMNAQFIAHHIPHSKFIGYHTGGHMLVGHSGEVTSSILSFLHDL